MYKNIITIGFNCAGACSCRRYGLRSRDYPWDWGVSTLKGVIMAIDEGFTDFLEKKWIKEVENGMYYHTKYEYFFAHDFEDGLWNEMDFEGQFQYVIRKYQIKWKHFLEDYQDSALFIRQIKNMEEAVYITENLEHIEQTLRTGARTGNKILWIAEKEVKEYLESKSIPCYEAEIDWSDGSTGYLLNRNMELKSFLMNHQIGSEQQVNNLLYSESLQNVKMQIKTIDGRIKAKLIKVIADRAKKQELGEYMEQKKFVLYGAGELGTLFGGIMAEEEIFPLFYLDKFKKKAGMEIFQRKVVTVHQSDDYEKPERILIAIPYEGEQIEIIVKRLQSYYYCEVVNLEDLLDGILE